MPGSCNEITERLYLQKDVSGDIYVPSSNLTEDQIDGLRFIFSQYKKKKLGVILNQPADCVNLVQVALFINAVCEQLNRPVLILYNSDDEKEAWLAQFAEGTSIAKDSIEVDTSYVYLRKKIFIQNIADNNIWNFKKRCWGIVVVKCDNFGNFFKNCQMYVDFKIWITSQNLKEDRAFLRAVCNWINPVDQLLQQYLDPKCPPTSKENTENEILLDVLLEDILYTTRGYKPCGTLKRRHEQQTPSRVSKKNKDATGTKIKRSTKFVDDLVPSMLTICTKSVPSIHNNDLSFESSVSRSDSNSGNVTGSVVNIDKIDNDEEESKMDVESFIRDNDPLQPDSNLSFAISNLDNTSQPSDTSSPKVEEAFTESSMNFTDAVDDLIRLEIKLPEQSEDLKSSNGEIAVDGNLTLDATVAEDVEKNVSTILNGIDLSNPLNRKIFFVTENGSGATVELGEVKTEQETSVQNSGTGDQTRTLEVSTSVMDETESSFDSKMKELEEKALRKFKGSFLDNIFKC